MGILATDILIKTAIEGGIADLKRNSWMLEDVFGGLATDPLSAKEYGTKEVTQAIQWFLNNEMHVYLGFRVDLPTMPAISIVQTACGEALDRTSLADVGMTEEIDHRKANQAPDKVLTTFTPKEYNADQGLVTLPDHLSSNQIAVGMYLVTKAGKSFQILSTPSARSFTIKSETKLNLTECTVVPATRLWNLHREITYLNESYNIGLHTVSDPVTNVWIRQVVLYILNRYKEVYFEARGLELTTFNCSGMRLNSYFDQERVFTTDIHFSGIVQADWIKFIAPKLAKTTARIDMAKARQNASGPEDSILTPAQYRDQVKSQTWAMKGDFNHEEDEAYL